MFSRKILMVISAFVVLLMLAAPAQALADLEVTSSNLNTLNSFTYSGAWYGVGANSYVLEWYGGGEYFEPPWKAPALYHGIVTATIMADYQGYYWGQCVSMAKNLAHSTVITADWYRGSHVVDGGIEPGTVIANFYWSPGEGRYVYVSDGTSCHTAIFREYTYNQYGDINGMIVWDQNWNQNENGEGIVMMHKISSTGYGGVSDANAYYVVQV